MPKRMPKRGRTVASTKRRRTGTARPTSSSGPARRVVGAARSEPLVRVEQEQDPERDHGLEHGRARPPCDGSEPAAIVGVGASAGGLEALEQLLSAVSSEARLAFVIVQHRDPRRPNNLPQLLRRATHLDVHEAADGERLEAGTALIAPADRLVSFDGPLVRLVAPPAVGRAGGLNLPIDQLFRSLASAHGPRGIAVVLSGAGSDGTLGLRAVKERGGAGFVQAPETAGADGMPRSAIEAGLADVVAAPAELAARISDYAARADDRGNGAEQVPGPTQHEQSALDKLFLLLRLQTGTDFSLYKSTTIYRRIQRRMGLHQLTRLPLYVRYLRDNPKEIELLFKELLIGVTSFFRDPLVWEQLRNEVLPDLVRARAREGCVRAWVAGCSTGEEAYSLAIVLSETLEALRLSRSAAIQIFATDLDKESVERARLGVYPPNIAADVSPARLRRYFVRDDRGFRISSDIREMVIFAPQNVIVDPPFTRLDIVSCRNLLIYLSPELQKKLIPLFHYTLNPSGIMLLGSAETTGAFSSLFAPLSGKGRLYRKVATAATSGPLDVRPARIGRGGWALTPEASSYEPPRPAAHELQTVVERIILERIAPAVLLTNHEGDILYLSGRTDQVLQPPAGKANLNVFAMAHPRLRSALQSGYALVKRQRRAVTLRGVRLSATRSAGAVDMSIEYLEHPRLLRGTVMLVVSPSSAPARSVASPRPRAGKLSELAREVEEAREQIQRTHEEMQASQEELKSANEELQSTNEELQSTNEDLTTSKEEMQSMNEELQTVNYELQAKVDELSRSNNDMSNLLNSTDIATLFLDGHLRVRRYTSQTAELIKLIPADLGRPITDLASNLSYPELAEDAREVLRTLMYSEKHVASHDGRWFQVRIMPYRTIENVIDGVVITFTDGTSGKLLDRAHSQLEELLGQVLASHSSLAWVCRPDGACEHVNPRVLERLRLSAAETGGASWFTWARPEDRQRLGEAWRAGVAADGAFELSTRFGGDGGEGVQGRVRCFPIRPPLGQAPRWWCSVEL